MMELVDQSFEGVPIQMKGRENVFKLLGLDYLGFDYSINMMLIDAVVGNTDRHLLNMAWLRSSTTGEYLRPTPLFDFDCALHDRDGILIKEFADFLKQQDKGVIQSAMHKLQSISTLDTLDVFKDRAGLILNLL